MRRTVSRVILILAALGATSGLLWAQSMNTIQVQSTPDGVNYLTDAKGMTLYYFTPDTTGQSACYGDCAKAWPIFYTPTITVPDSLDAKDFGTITRTDGTKETTYKGWPLYYWVNDKNPGDMSGEGVHGVWYILKVPAYTVMIGTNKAVGNYLTDGDGASLYYFTKDSAGMSACSGDCLKAWPAFTASSFVVLSALDAADFGSITRDNGTMQVTFKGYPMYYWVKDQKRGDITGQGVGKVWYVVDPAKFDPGKK
jgi:predicted lipoprotein with Yx(FWY)xxD motif